MKNGLVIADSGPIFSLALIDRLDLLDKLFDDVKISHAVWIEISTDESKPFHKRICLYFQDKVTQIKGFNDLTFVMDNGESESVILYKELQANFLLIDDKKARSIAENFGINCVGTIGLLSIAKDRGFVEYLKPLFDLFLRNHRYYSIEILNALLLQQGENKIGNQP
jgi:predicted nucleic acid-binding protein